MSAINNAIITELMPLKNVVPLETPFSVTISIGNTCDFKCIYCGQHLKKEESHKLMTLEEFEIIVNQLKAFKQPLKQIAFVSSGETLLNKKLPEMIQLIKKENVAESVKIITNASHLTKEYSDKLLEAGLDIMKISLQGLSAESYERVCKVKINYDKFLDQIKYFYENRGRCKLHIKMIDIALDEGEEQKFYKYFEEISDFIFIEHCCQEEETAGNKYFMDTRGAQICPMPFYSFFIDEWLDVFPCCMVNRDMIETDKILGNLKERTIMQLWSNEFKEIWQYLLVQQIPIDSICNKCKRFVAFIRELDILDENYTSILKRLDVWEN